jgi:transposase
MPRMGGSAVAIRFELVKLAEQEVLSIRELCRRFRVSAPTAYKWMARFAHEGMAGLEDRSHRPHRQPRRSSAELEQQVLALRRRYPVWGPRKLRKLLSDALPAPLPSVSTVSAILRRHNLTGRARAGRRRLFAPALRIRGAQGTVADGLQGALRLAPWPLPSADRAG